VRHYQIPIFFVLAYALTWLVWGSEIAQQHGWLSFHIPGTFAYWSLTIAVLIVASLASGKAALLDIVHRIFRWRVGIQWYALALFVPAVLVVVPAVIYRLFGGNVPVGTYMSPIGALIYAATFGPVSWLTEETAWRGFALPRLQAGRSALTASLILGLLWGIWHTPLFFIAGTGQSTWPYVGFLLFTLAESVLITWIFNNTRGSVLLANIFHIASNITLSYAGILSGSSFLFWLGVAVYLIAAIIVVLVEGPARLSRANVVDDSAIVSPSYVAA
jgi:membrane protease YdiL (CAAX protease family)